MINHASISELLWLGDHVYNRWILIHCENVVAEEDQIKDLQDKMFEERDSFCIKALRAFQEAVANNYTFSIPETCTAAISEYKTRNSSVRMFVEECCKPLDKDCVNKSQTTGKFWEVFKLWCTDENYYAPNKSEFRRELAQALGVPESDLIEHTRDGNFYPCVVNEETIQEYIPWG